MSSLKQFRKRFIGAIGVRATHALQDGASLGTLFSLALVYPPAVALLAAWLGTDGIRPRRVIAQADELVRVDDIKPHPEYFIGGFGVGSVGGAGVGIVLKAVAAWSGVSASLPV
jgi:hypothetical protein